MKEEQYYEIEQYLNGELEGEALLSFENRLQTDASLAESLALFKSLNAEMPRLLETRAHRDQLHTILEKENASWVEQDKATVTPINKIKKFWYTAAAAVLLVAVSVFLLNPQKQDLPALYAAYAGDEQISLVSRDTGNQTDLAAITNFYNGKNFAAAIPILEILIQKEPAMLRYKMVLARCFIETGEYAKAFNLLDSISSGASAYQYEAAWLKAMAYLKQNQWEESERILQSIPPQADNYSKAKELLEKMQ